MERDFMGMRSNPSPLTVKEEPDDGSIDSARMRGSSLQWSFTNTASQLLSFKSTQERAGTQYPQFSQRNLPLDKQGGSQYPVTAHHWHHSELLPINHAPEGRVFPPTGQNTVPAAMSSSILPSHLMSSTLGGPSAMSALSIPHPNGPVVGSTDLRSSPSISTGPCQLTIFYNGSVCVYDNVSPEKAQAIMLLAGNGDSTKSSTPTMPLSCAPKVQPLVPSLPANDSAIPSQSSVLRLSAIDTASPNQPSMLRLRPNNSAIGNQPPALRFSAKDTASPNQSIGFSSSLISPTPNTSAPLVTSTSIAEANPVKPVAAPAQTKYSDPPKSDVPGGGSPLKLIPSAVPQARKASLARFLEKRKERVVSAAPYVVSKNNSECSTIGPGGPNFATNSANSTPLPASN